MPAHSSPICTHKKEASIARHRRAKFSAPSFRRGETSAILKRANLFWYSPLSPPSIELFVKSVLGFRNSLATTLLNKRSCFFSNSRLPPPQDHSEDNSPLRLRAVCTEIR